VDHGKNEEFIDPKEIEKMCQQVTASRKQLFGAIQVV